VKCKIEKDSLGEVRVPAGKYYGAQTQRALENFKIGREKMPMEIISAFAYIKKAAAVVNCELGSLDKEKKEYIVQVCDEILEEKLNIHFPLPVWQTGSGTQTNMNVNEVIAGRASELAAGSGSRVCLHPNDDVNKSQSSNDTFPTAMSIAAIISIETALLPALDGLKKNLEEKSSRFIKIIKTGRTHLMDATPISLGQEFSGYASQVEHGIKTIKNSLDHLRELAMGGTATGTGLNTKKGYAEKVAEKISEFTGHRFITAKNKFEAIAAHDAAVETSGSLKTAAVALMKIANDIRWLASGPNCSIGEITVPANEPGSSIMPGKVNPTQAEALLMVCAQTIGNDITINISGASGNFELNTFKPVIIYCLLQSIHNMSDAVRSFTVNMVSGIEPNLDRIQGHLSSSLMLVTALNPVVGYENAAKIAQRAFQNKCTLKEAAVNLGLLSAEEFDRAVNPVKMITPG